MTFHPYVLESDGTVMAWGNGATGELGNGTKTPFQETPVIVRLPGVATALGEADQDGAAIVEGHPYVWGDGAKGALCGVTKADEPVRLEAPQTFVEVQGAGGHMLWRTADGEVFGCGADNDGQLGFAGPKKIDTLTRVPVEDVVQVTAGPLSSAVRTSAGKILTFGSNAHGQAGVASGAAKVEIPTEVRLPGAAVDVSAGGDRPANGQMLAVLADGELCGWGDDEDGQLGDEGDSDATRAPICGQLRGIETAVTGDAFSLALTREGTLLSFGAASEPLCSGRSTEGQLGTGLATGVERRPESVESGVHEVQATAGESLIR
ncbi:MAG TPA: hypothetical protein VGY13_11095 [Solirubrobacteraceae bacterium]|nr:hypothetical protein [Solirubrobacteraceae bacterium]